MRDKLKNTGYKDVVYGIYVLLETLEKKEIL